MISLIGTEITHLTGRFLIVPSRRLVPSHFYGDERGGRGDRGLMNHSFWIDSTRNVRPRFDDVSRPFVHGYVRYMFFLLQE